MVIKHVSMNDILGSTDYFGKMFDIRGRMLDTDGEPIEQWVIDLRNSVLSRRSKPKGPLKPNKGRVMDFIKTAALCEKAIKLTGGKMWAEFDDDAGCLSIIIKAKTIDVDQRVDNLTKMLEQANNVSASAFLDGTVSMSIVFYGVLSESE